jgi:hypothetical protein
MLGGFAKMSYICGVEEEAVLTMKNSWKIIAQILAYVIGNDYLCSTIIKLVTN